MAKFLPGIVAMLVLGCANAPEELSVVSKNDAVEDYIHVAELKEIDLIRSFDQLHHKVVTEKYIVIYDRRDTYLAAFKRRCRELNDHMVTADVRHDKNVLRARFDSIRGCRIEALYEIDEGQAQEVMNLGQESGK